MSRTVVIFYRLYYVKYGYMSFVYMGTTLLAETRNSSMGSPWEIDPMSYHIMSGHFTMVLHL